MQHTVLQKGLGHPYALVSQGDPRTTPCGYQGHCYKSEPGSEKLQELPDPANVPGSSSFSAAVLKEQERKKKKVNSEMLSSILHCSSRTLSFNDLLAILKLCLSGLKNIASLSLETQRNFALCPKYLSFPEQFPLLREMLSCQAALPLNQTTFSTSLSV